jgi:hypothetical protein
MHWKHPPIIKIYETLGSVADGRVEVSGNTAKVYSSSRNKYYDVIYDPDKNAIMTNDNGSFWKGYLGYPAIAFLMKIGVLPYEKDVGELLANIPWKDINQKFKNDFDKTIEFILSSKTETERTKLMVFTQKVDQEIEKLNLSLLGKKTTPPRGY